MPTISATSPPKIRSSSNANALPSSLPLFPAKSPTPKPFSHPITDPEESSSVKPEATATPSQPRALVGNVMEREISDEKPMPPEPYELDEALHRQEVATEFYKLRNRRIQQEGGFLHDDEESQQIIPLGEPESDDPRKKMSRFMAARMK